VYRLHWRIASCSQPGFVFCEGRNINLSIRCRLIVVLHVNTTILLDLVLLLYNSLVNDRYINPIIFPRSLQCVFLPTSVINFSIKSQVVLQLV